MTHIRAMMYLVNVRANDAVSEPLRVAHWHSAVMQICGEHINEKSSTQSINGYDRSCVNKYGVKKSQANRSGKSTASIQKQRFNGMLPISRQRSEVTRGVVDRVHAPKKWHGVHHAVCTIRAEINRQHCHDGSHYRL